MLLQRWFVRLTIPTSPSPPPPPNLGIAQSDKIHSLIMQFSLFRLLLKQRNTKKYIPIEKQIVSTHHRKTETSKTQDY